MTKEGARTCKPRDDLIHLVEASRDSHQNRSVYSGTTPVITPLYLGKRAGRGHAILRNLDTRGLRPDEVSYYTRGIRKSSPVIPLNGMSLLLFADPLFV